MLCDLCAALWCRSSDKDMFDFSQELSSSIRNIVVIATVWRVLPILWAALDILCKDTNKAAEASSATVKTIREMVSPWRVLWYLSMVARQVYKL